MITDPDRYLEAFVDAGANMVSVHVEVLPHLHRTVAQIKKLGAKAGVVLNPSTPVGAIEEVAADVDFVLVMSVNPGFGGQVFIPHSVDKIRRVRALLDRAGNRAPIEVDGGIDLTTVEERRRRGRRIARRRQRDLRQRRSPRQPGARCDRRPSDNRGRARSAVRPVRTLAVVRVRYAETDEMGVVYYANYLVWFEVGRTDWLRETGWTYREMEAEGI